MLVTMPQSDRHTTVQLLVATPKGTMDIVADQSHKTFDIPLPAGVKEHEVSVTAQFLTSGGQPDLKSEVTILKEAAKSKPAPKPEPKPEAPKPEPKTRAQAGTQG
jgi:hypothetical protein